MHSPKAKKIAKSGARVTKDANRRPGAPSPKSSPKNQSTPTKSTRASVQNLTIDSGSEPASPDRTMQRYEPSSPIASVSPKVKRGNRSEARRGVSKINLNANETHVGTQPQDSQKVLFSPAGHRTDEKAKAPPQRAHSYTNYDSSQDGEKYDHDEIRVIQGLPRLTQEMKERKSPIPRKSPDDHKICLALDLDETLVHCSIEALPNAEMTFDVNFNGVDYKVYVRTRPHLQEFLRQVSQWFEVIIFTASQKVYANKLLNILDPNHEYIRYRLFRDSCLNVGGTYVKDLHICGRDLRHICIVDNSVQAFGYQVENGIPIESWFDDNDDRELMNLLSFLENLKDVQDVRPMIRETFNLEQYISSVV